MSLITIFLLIGFANWAAHLLQCSSCANVISGLIQLFFTGVISVCAWPFHLVNLLRAQPKKQTPENLFDQLRESGMLIQFEKRDDETDQQFQNRIISEMAFHMKEDFIKNKKREAKS